MAVNIVVPELSESVVEATVSEWLKKEGDTVEAGDIVVVLETDKVSLEVTADASGVLARIDYPEGSDVTARTVLGSIDESGAASGAAVETPAPTTHEMPTEQPPTEANAPAREAAQSASGEQGRPATPVAQRVAAAHGVDIAQVPASGNKVKKGDVEVYVKGGSSAPETPAAKPAPASAAPVAKPAAKPSANGSTSSADRPEKRQRMSRRRHANGLCRPVCRTRLRSAERPSRRGQYDDR